MEITNVRARKVISDAFFYFIFKFDKIILMMIYNYEIQKLILFHDSM